MYNYFSQTTQTKKVAIEKAASKMGVDPIFIEKDLWVTIILKALFSEDMSGSFILKGDTSLSKAYNITTRFNDNLSISMARSLLGNYPSTSELLQLDQTQRDRIVDEIYQRAQSYCKEQFVPLLKFKMEEITQKNVELKMSLDTPLSIEVYYPSLFMERNLYIAPKINVGIEIGEQLEAYSIKRITSFMHKLIPSLEDLSSDIKTVTPFNIFYEIALILHKEVDRLATASTSLKTSCYYYDLYQLAVKGYASEAVRQIHLLKDAILHNMLSHKLDEAAYETILAHGIKLLPPEERIKGLKSDYKKMENIFFNSYPPMEEILGTLKEIERYINMALEKLSG